MRFTRLPLNASRFANDTRYESPLLSSSCCFILLRYVRSVEVNHGYIWHAVFIAGHAERHANMIASLPLNSSLQ